MTWLRPRWRCFCGARFWTRSGYWRHKEAASNYQGASVRVGNVIYVMPFSDLEYFQGTLRKLEKARQEITRSADQQNPDHSRQ